MTDEIAVGHLRAYIGSDGGLTVQTPSGEDYASLSLGDTRAFLEWLRAQFEPKAPVNEGLMNQQSKPSQEPNYSVSLELDCPKCGCSRVFSGTVPGVLNCIVCGTENRRDEHG